MSRTEVIYFRIYYPDTNPTDCSARTTKMVVENGDSMHDALVVPVMTCRLFAATCCVATDRP